MLMVISPAKTLDYESPLATEHHTKPQMVDESETLIQLCRELTPMDISQLMKVSDKIAGLNVARFANWSRDFSLENARQAILAFKGDVYTGFCAETLSEADFNWAQANLRILSGLYGVLRPLDLIHAYRLEMGTKLANQRGANLYQFWGDKITESLNQTLKEKGTDIVINLASNEYFKAVKPQKLNAQIVTPIFKDYKNGQYKIISFYAKKARGMMARFIVDKRIERIEGLKEFDVDGYFFCPASSNERELVFKRAER